MKSLKQLAETHNKLLADNRAILDKADVESRVLSAEEQQEYDLREKEIDKAADEMQALSDHETRRQRLATREQEANRPLPRQVPPVQPGANPPRGGDGANLEIEYGKLGKFRVNNRLSPMELEQIRLRSSQSYSELFSRYLAGEKDNWQQLGLVVGDDTRGGYTVPMDFLSMFIKFLDDQVWIRSLATVLPPTMAKSVGALSYDTDLADADWTAEIPASDISEDSAMRFGKRELSPWLLTKLVKAGRKLLRSSTMGMASFIAQRGAYKFGVTEEKSFLTGTGAGRPLGVFVASNDGIPTSQDTTASATTTFTADDLINVEESIKDVYSARAQWLGSRTFRKMCRKLKDGEGRYLLQTNTTLPGGLSMLNGKPLRVSEFAPSTFTTGQYIAIFCDWSYYWIQDGMGMEIQQLDELFALRNQTGWVMRKETDAMPVLSEAFARLILA